MQENLMTLYDYDKAYVRNVLKRERDFKVPAKGGPLRIKSTELVEWLIEEQSKDEIRKLVTMMKAIRKRNASVRTLIETIAIGLIK
ncbi:MULTISPECIES: hypothetical protein [Bacillaceae]|uniref:hypothetical protein n=1 Tax=Bacillaceae TaxID=186817 RepID=UPI001E3CDEBB|nr:MULTISPECIES: hypothetical protein [Bacillaceae]MCE4051317.1 hypothetical protein [Bacillus sp. Au-Bac7]MCM3032222.1 hypothetical protein [Niallia sp. MER 6]MDL0436703.1 hypothetical protein [Niallia sp. SS-2023]